MKIVCKSLPLMSADNIGFGEILTLNKEYEVITEYGNMYRIKNDYNTEWLYYKYIFYTKQELRQLKLKKLYESNLYK